MIDVNEFRRNQSQVPASELEKFNGQYVAWSEDGTHILKGDTDPLKLDAWMIAAGLDPGEILVTRICFPEDVSCSPWLLPEEAKSL